MRSSRQRKTLKKPYRHRINKKKHKNKSKGYWSWSDTVSRHYLEDINEVLRENKARRAEGRGTWKVVPKDSCEVYKDRRKRNLESDRRKQENTEDASNDTEMEVEKRVRKKPRKRHQKKKVPAKKFKSRSQNKKRVREPSHSSYTNTTTSHSSISEMEYE